VLDIRSEAANEGVLRLEGAEATRDPRPLFVRGRVTARRDVIDTFTPESRGIVADAQADGGVEVVISRAAQRAIIVTKHEAHPANRN
jgi:hypothetical protein